MSDGYWRRQGGADNYYVGVSTNPVGSVMFDQDIRGYWWWRAAMFGPDGMVREEASHPSMFWAMRWVEGRALMPPRGELAA